MFSQRDIENMKKVTRVFFSDGEKEEILESLDKADKIMHYMELTASKLANDITTSNASLQKAKGYVYAISLTVLLNMLVPFVNISFYAVIGLNSLPLVLCAILWQVLGGKDSGKV